MYFGAEHRAAIEDLKRKHEADLQALEAKTAADHGACLGFGPVAQLSLVVQLSDRLYNLLGTHSTTMLLLLLYLVLAATVQDMTEKQAALNAQMSKYKEQKSVLVEAVRAFPLQGLTDAGVVAVAVAGSAWNSVVDRWWWSGRPKSSKPTLTLPTRRLTT